MPRLRGAVSVLRVSQKKSERTSGRRQIGGASSGQWAGLTSLLVKGTRTILGALPASGITTPIVDFVCKSLGWSTLVRYENLLVIVDPAYHAGVVGGFYLKPKAFLGNVPSMSVNAPVADGNLNSTNVWWQFMEYQIVQFRLVCKSSSPAGSTSGNWAVGFYPFVNESDGKMVASQLNGKFSYQVLLRFPVSKVARVCDSIILKYYFTMKDWYSYQFHAVDTSIGFVWIAYENFSRTKTSAPVTMSE